MKTFLHILSLLLLNCSILAQPSTLNPLSLNEKTTSKHQFDVGIELIASTFSYTRKINNNVRIGASFGFLGAIAFGVAYSKKTSFNFHSLNAETLHIGPLIEFKLTNKLLYEFKPHLTYYNAEVMIGLKNGVFFQLKKIKLGLNVFVGRDYNHFSKSWVIYVIPLQLKIPVQW